ncbi:hypothetical protein BGZ90_007316, partial [Linnemannia elongata]
FSADSSGQLFSDELLQKYLARNPEYATCGDPYLTEQNQHVVKILIIENDMSAVLTLARHPLIPLDNLDSIGWGHSFGIDHLGEYCLQSYVYLNILAEFPEWCQNEKYRKLGAFQQLERRITTTCDGDGQMPMHRSFYYDLNKEGQFVARDIFGDMGRMKEYLKRCFAVIYRYDMVAKEYGREVDWLG